MKAADKLLKKLEQVEQTSTEDLKKESPKEQTNTEAKPVVKCVPLPRGILNKIPPVELL